MLPLCSATQKQGFGMFSFECMPFPAASKDDGTEGMPSPCLNTIWEGEHQTHKRSDTEM